MDLRSELNLTASEVQAQLPVTVFHLEGRINLSNSAELEALAKEHYERGMRHLLLDFDGVPSITSAGLRAIHLIYQLLEADDQASQQRADASVGQSSRLKIFAPSPQIRNVLRTAGFDQYIAVFDDRQAALDSFGAAA